MTDDNITPATFEQVMEMRDRHEQELVKIQGVVGVGIGQGENGPAISVYVERDTPAIREIIPTSIDGVEVVVEEGDSLAF